MSKKDLFKKKEYIEPTSIGLTKKEKAKLTAEAKKHDVSFSEYARTILVKYG